MIKRILKIDPVDDLAVALTRLTAGETVSLDDKTIEIISDVKAKHKIALRDFDPDETIKMYGVIVGKAVKKIRKGEVITSENIKHQSDKVVINDETFQWTPPSTDKWTNKTFLGYHRKDGQVGTNNIWLFFPLVFCENRNIELLKEIFEKELYRDEPDTHRLFLRSLIRNKEPGFVEKPEKLSKRVFENIDVKFITHPGGCGAIRQDAESLAKLLAGYVKNPNVVGVSVLSLGCQNLQIKDFKKALKDLNVPSDKPVLIFEQQQMGTVDEMLTAVIKESFKGIEKANAIERKPAPLSKLVVGLECGGSDGFSGISANPLLGRVSDYLVALKAKVILSEFPELCGVEQEIVNRCTNKKIAVKFLSLMKNFEESVVNAGSGFDMNPSPGNIADGLITDAMKSAGAAKKGGTSPVEDVLDYGEYVTKKGLNLLCTPGNDVESTTAMAGSGANIVLFTTGLGTPTGNPVSPVIKISSNTKLAKKMPDIIDLDAGPVIVGEKSIDALAEELLDLIIEVASGEKRTKSMLKDQDDFIPWKKGVSL